MRCPPRGSSCSVTVAVPPPRVPTTGSTNVTFGAAASASHTRRVCKYAGFQLVAVYGHLTIVRLASRFGWLSLYMEFKAGQVAVSLLRKRLKAPLHGHSRGDMGCSWLA
jgi:hypothetical protein